MGNKLMDLLRGTPAQRGPQRIEAEVLVIGLGRFGSALASELVSLGHEVLGVDTSLEVVQDHKDLITHAIQADCTNIKALKQLGAKDFSKVVVGIGGDLEASVLITSNLVELGVESVWAKAVTDAHGRILRRVGADNVIYPEREMGIRTAHMVTGSMIDFMELDEGEFSLAETTVPHFMVGKTVGEVNAKNQYGVTIVALKPLGGTFTNAAADRRLGEGDYLVLGGTPSQTEAVCGLR